MTIELRVPGARALVEPVAGGRLHQLFIEIDGLERPLLHAPDDPADHLARPLAGGCYPMAPWPNRIRDDAFEWRGRTFTIDNKREHALHGLVADRPWEVVARTGRVVELARDLGPGWPWEGRAWQRIELGARFLAMKIEVRSAREPFPAGCGWHPWFRRDVAGAEDASVTLHASRRYDLRDNLPTGATREVDREALLDGRPLGARRLDDCFAGFEPGKAVATVEWPRLRLQLAVQCRYPHVQVFTPPGALCIEPQTCAPDAFNLAARGLLDAGFAVAEPGRPVSLAARWSWEIPPAGGSV